MSINQVVIGSTLSWASQADPTSRPFCLCDSNLFRRQLYLFVQLTFKKLVYSKSWFFFSFFLPLYLPFSSCTCLGQWWSLSPHEISCGTAETQHLRGTRMCYLIETQSFLSSISSVIVFLFLCLFYWVLNQKEINKLGEREACSRKERGLWRGFHVFSMKLFWCAVGEEAGRKTERERERAWNMFFPLLLRRAINKPWSHSTLWVWGLLSFKDISFQEGLEIKNRPWRIFLAPHMFGKMFCK